MVASILRRFWPHLLVAGLLAFLWWRYSAAVEETGRLAAENNQLAAANAANVTAIEDLGKEIDRRDRVHREIAADLAALRTDRQTLKTRLNEVNANAPEAFRDCLAINLPAEHISLQPAAKTD